MGNLSSNTEVNGRDGSWVAEISDDMRLWGPNGGYLATVALRAAGQHIGGQRPASLECHFLKSPAPGAVELTTTTLRRTRRAHSVQVTMVQDGQLILQAMVWSVDFGLDGLPARSVPPPDVPGPHGLKAMHELFSPEQWGREPFWQHVEERPVDPQEHLDWPAVPGAEAVRCSWLRYRSCTDSSDLYLEAGRSVIAIDVYPFLAGVIVLQQHEFTHAAPTLSLSVVFNDLRRTSDWLLFRAESSFAGEGLFSGSAQVWSEDGRLVASGGSQMLCRSLLPGGNG
jgi:acyl-CoA thioesterase